MNNIRTFEQFEMNEELSSRKLSDIATEIYSDWKPVNFAAKPYLEAMASLDNITDMYEQDPASGIVAYFLGNATSWKGEKARTIKKELNDMLKQYYKKNK